MCQNKDYTFVIWIVSKIVTKKNYYKKKFEKSEYHLDFTVWKFKSYVIHLNFIHLKNIYPCKAHFLFCFSSHTLNLDFKKVHLNLESCLNFWLLNIEIGT